MNSVLKVFAIASLAVAPVAGFAADGAEALQRHHERNKQRFHDSEMRLQNQTSIDKGKSDNPQAKNKSSSEMSEVNAHNEISLTQDGGKKK